MMKRNLFSRLLAMLLCALLILPGQVAQAENARNITMYMIALGPVPSGIREVEDAINAISVPEIGVKINLMMNSVAEYAQQMGLMITSGEKLDLVITIPMGSGQFRSMVAQNQLADITELIAQHGQGIVQALDDVKPGMLADTTVAGAVRGVTALYNKVSNVYWLFRKDILEKHGFNVDDLKTMDDVEKVLATVKEQEDGMIPLAASAEGNVLTLANAYAQDDLGNAITYDSLGDSTTRVGVAFYDNPKQVVNNYASDAYRAAIDRVHKWYEAGYIHKDAATVKDTAETLAAAGNVFSWISESEFGVEANKSSQVGYPLVAKKLSTGTISTTQLTKFVWGVPSTSQEQEAAVKFLNLMYTEPKIANLLAWGIEGRDYVVNADGLAAYPEGVTAQNVPYHQADFMIGNQFNVIPWVGNPADLRDIIRKENQEAPVSELLGFAYDPVNMTNELSAIVNVLAEYRASLESGIANPEETLPKFLQALKDAGADELIADIQSQLDAWLASK